MLFLVLNLCCVLELVPGMLFSVCLGTDIDLSCCRIAVSLSDLYVTLSIRDCVVC